MGKKIKFAYCDYCKKEIEHPATRPMDGLYKNIWAIVILATLGTGAIALIIYLKFIRPKKFCPTCESDLKFSYEPFDKPKSKDDKDKSAKEKVLEKIEEKKDSGRRPAPIVEEEDDDDKIYCPFCGNELEADIVTCPFCKTVIK